MDDWQIVQQDASGFAGLNLLGRWFADEAAAGQACLVEVRVVAGDTGVALSSSLDWQAASTESNGLWYISLRIPAGGLYRLETRCRSSVQLDREWSLRGDMRHFWGVGDLWVIAGQSNSAGYGRGAVYDPPELGLHLLRNSGQWSLAFHPMNDSTATDHPVNRERSNPAHSPYLHFARLLKQQLNYPIGLIQTALGGSPLSAWNPSEPGDAVLFHNMMRCVNKAGGAVKGILWYQGESDCSPGLAESYAIRFSGALQAWREAFKQPVLPVLTVQLNRYFPYPALLPAGDETHARAWSQVREAQRQLARSQLQVAIVPAFDLPLSDLIHSSPAGNMLLGERLARAALGMVYGKMIDYRAPDIESARLREQGTLLELSFANVSDRLDNFQRASNCFKIEDSAGEVLVSEVVYPMNHTLQLRLSRCPAAEAVVHGAYGYDPVMTPVDMGRVLPILGFYQFAIDVNIDCP